MMTSVLVSPDGKYEYEAPTAPSPAIIIST